MIKTHFELFTFSFCNQFHHLVYIHFSEKNFFFLLDFLQIIPKFQERKNKSEIVCETWQMRCVRIINIITKFYKYSNFGGNLEHSYAKMHNYKIYYRNCMTRIHLKKGPNHNAT